MSEMINTAFDKVFGQHTGFMGSPVADFNTLPPDDTCGTAPVEGCTGCCKITTVGIISAT